MHSRSYELKIQQRRSFHRLQWQPPPKLIQSNICRLDQVDEAMLSGMRPGSVVLDMAANANTGGNVAGSVAGTKTVHTWVN